MNLPGYDAWKLDSPDDERDAIGDEAGQVCGRYHEPDEDAPRVYKPKPCRGEMEYDDDYETLRCNLCGEISYT